MKLQWWPLITLLVVNFALDLWLFARYKKSKYAPRLKSVAHAVLSLVLLAMMIVAISLPRTECDNATFVAIMWMIYTYYAFYVPRYVAALVWVPTHLKKSGPRWRVTGGVLATVIGLIVFAIMWWGALVVPYQLNVQRVDLEYENLPQEFDGYKIAQFSDTHLGTYNGDTAFVAQYVDSINNLGADLIVFTGDLVSRQTSEALPYKGILSRLEAPDGVLSVLGNHDDDSYMHWNSEKAKVADQQALIDLEDEMGWHLLVNDYVVLRRADSEVAVIGTKNFNGWPLPKKGFLDTAYVDYDSDKRFKILLQHNPDQWKLDKAFEKHVIDLRLCDKVDLMLTGHTHAMQCQFSFFGHKISPACFKYERWSGLYEHGKNKLYVNIGTGLVGMPARIWSATPEVTLITLHKKK